MWRHTRNAPLPPLYYSDKARNVNITSYFTVQENPKAKQDMVRWLPMSVRRCFTPSVKATIKLKLYKIQWIIVDKTRSFRPLFTPLPSLLLTSGQYEKTSHTVTNNMPRCDIASCDFQPVAYVFVLIIGSKLTPRPPKNRTISLPSVLWHHCIVSPWRRPLRNNKTKKGVSHVRGRAREDIQVYI